MASARPPQSWNEKIIEQFRANEGQMTSGPFTGRSLLLLTGAPTDPAWFHNLQTHPEVTVEVGKEKFRARAKKVADDAERRRLYDQHAEKMPAFLDYEKKTTRKIPVVVLERI